MRTEKSSNDQPLDEFTINACARVIEDYATEFHDATARMSETVVLFHAATRVRQLFDPLYRPGGGRYPSEEELAERAL